MSKRLSFWQIKKYASRLQGNGLLPFLWMWQIKRAVRILINDGSQDSILAIRNGWETGMLSSTAYKDRYISVLKRELQKSGSSLTATRIREHLDAANRTKPSPGGQQNRADNNTTATATAVASTRPQLQDLRETKDPLAALKEHVQSATPLANYRDAARKRVHEDSTGVLLKNICELWDKTGGSQKETLRRLIEFIGILPEHPLELRCNVALSCGMATRLANDDPSIAPHLSIAVQSQHRTDAAITAIKNLRRDDTRNEICRLWFVVFQANRFDSNFEEALRRLGFLPSDPVEQQVAVALACGLTDRLNLEYLAIQEQLLALADHPRVGSQARLALRKAQDSYITKAKDNNLATDSKPQNSLPAIPGNATANETQPTRLTTSASIEELTKFLKAGSIPTAYCSTLRDQAKSDTSGSLLHYICELWAKSSGVQKDILQNLIEFIELVPERPLWLRRNVALDCGMPGKLADDKPPIAQYLIDTTQLRIRKEAVLSAVSQLRREDTKAEICRLWYEQHKQGVDDRDFTDVLLRLGFLPLSPLPQRVAIALACGWGEKLAFDNEEIIAYIIPLVDDQRLGNEARRALANIKNTTTDEALSRQHKISARNTGESEAAIQQTTIGELSDTETIRQGTGEESSAELIDSANLRLSDSKNATSDKVEQPQNLGESLQNIDTGRENLTPKPHPIRPQTTQPHDYFIHNEEFQASDDWEDADLVIPRWDFEDGSDTQWVSRLDKLAGLPPEERQKIFTEIERSSADDEEWISELLSDHSHLIFKQPDSASLAANSDEIQPQTRKPQTKADNRQQEILEPARRNNQAQLEGILSKAGFVSTENDRYLVVSIIVAGNLVEVDRIEIETIDSFQGPDIREYAKACAEVADDISRQTNNNTDSTTYSAALESNLPSERDLALESLLLVGHPETKIGSTFAFLIECACDLLNSKPDYPLSEFQELIAGLLTFHARERIADIEAYECRLSMSEEALRKDSDCIAGATLEEISPYKNDILAARYKFDSQQPFRFSVHKNKDKPKVICQPGNIRLELDSIEEIQGFATVLLNKSDQHRLKRKANFIHIPNDFSQSIRQSLSQQAQRWIHAKEMLPNAFLHILKRTGSDNVRELNRRINENTSKRAALIGEYLFKSNGISLVIQGPPGSGKTSCAAEVICSLASKGFKVGICANSHLAIDTLLGKASSCANASKQAIRIAKYQPRISSKERDELRGKGIRAIDNKTFNMLFDIYGGTAHAFSKQMFEGLFDLLVIDEASQVSMANLLAMARCTRNILLVGDQQQLAQPTTANHPGESGLSCLAYATSDRQTVDNGIGIFLPKSWRMHPSICSFVSAKFYAGKLSSHEPNRLNSISSIQQENGLLFIPIEHEDNHVFSLEEANAIKQITHLLIGQRCIINSNYKTQEIVIDWDQIAIMAPYNAQVSLIQRTLGVNAKVGTVDRFQGQEAAISIYSMTTSHIETLKTIEFILSRNRVNVALSRSKCLSIIIGSPSLTGILNSNPEAQEERELLFSLTNFSGRLSSLKPKNDTKVSSHFEADNGAEGCFEISTCLTKPEMAASTAEDYNDLASIKLARKLFKFDLDSREILSLYRCRLFDELALFLDFCRWDDTEKPWQQTKLLMRLAASPNATPTLLTKLAERGECKTQEAVAANPTTPLNVIQDLIGRKSNTGRRGAAANPSLPKEIYWELFSHLDELTRRPLAENPNTPDEILHLLAEDTHEITQRLAREELVRRKSEADSTKRNLDESAPVQREYSSESAPITDLGFDASTISESLTSMVKSQDQKTRCAAASHSCLSSDHMYTLAFDSNDAVRCALATRLDLTQEVIRVLAFDESRFVRRLLAENPACTEEAFKRLVSDSDVYTRERVARHPLLTQKACSWLLADNQDRVILALSDNANIPITYFKEAQQSYYLESLRADKPIGLKALLLINSNCPAGNLSKIKIARKPAIRLALALSPHTKATTLQLLQSDEEPLIRKITHARLSMPGP